MGLIETEAIVLKGLRLGETDTLVTFFSLRRGLIKGVARGVRRPRSRFGASLEPFTHGRMICFEKNPGVLLRINQTEIIRPFLKIRGDLDRIEAAARMVRWVAALMPEGEPNPKVFRLLQSALAALEKPENPQWLLRVFEMRFLALAGYQPRLDRCLNCGGDLREGKAFFSPKSGGTVCRPCSRSAPDLLEPISNGTRSMMRWVGRMDWDRVFRFRASPAINAEVERILDAHLTYILDRPLKTASFRKEKVPAID